MVHLNPPAVTTAAIRLAFAEKLNTYNEVVVAALDLLAAGPRSETAVAASQTANVTPEAAGAASKTAVAASETAVAPSQIAGTASESAGATSETAVAAARAQLQKARRGVPRESGALKQGTLEQRKLNLLSMEQRRAVLVYTTIAHEQSMAAIRSTDPSFRDTPVHVPSPSHHRTFQEETMCVRKRIKWLNGQIGLEIVKIIELETDEPDVRRARSAPTGTPQKRAGSAATRTFLKRHRTWRQQMLPETAVCEVFCPVGMA